MEGQWSGPGQASRERPSVEDHLAADEPFGKSALGPAFHTPQTGHAGERVGVEPVSPSLGRESVDHEPGLVFSSPGGQLDIDGRLTQLAVELGDLVFKDKVIAKRLPGELSNEPVILMAVFPIVGQDDVGADVLTISSNRSLSPAPSYGK